MEFSKHNWATTICPEMLIFGKWASWTLFFQNILTNPIISEMSFLWRHTLVPYRELNKNVFERRTSAGTGLFSFLGDLWFCPKFRADCLYKSKDT